MPFERGFSLKTLNDSQLVFLTLEGNRESFNCLVDRYWPMAIALCISRISNVPEAEDIAQEGFIQAYQHLTTLKDPSRFAGWLTRIIQEKCVDHYRFSKKNRAVSQSKNPIPQQKPLDITVSQLDGDVLIKHSWEDGWKKIPHPLRRLNIQSLHEEI